MSILIKGMEMPKTCIECMFSEHGSINEFEYWCKLTGSRLGAWGDKQMWEDMRAADCPLIEMPPHGRLIDADELHKAMYHRAFETDGDTMWQSGCWVRYRAIEQVQDSQPTIIEAEEGEEE